MSGIQSVQNTALVKNLDQLTSTNSGKKSEKGEQPNFAGMVKNFLETVNANQQKAGAMAQEVVEGKTDSLVEPMVAMEESRLSFQLMLEVRNRVLESLKEVQRMPV
ncbi:MAG: flagellar hook-basal body complex protein FliE [FCB group bacterium]|nr:flagellar hook-basal body complex protein FliE [FCB group bacterium]